MSDLWRLTINEEAAPVTVTSSPDSTGAMVIRSPKGPSTPQKITKGQTAEILRRFGYPSSTYPDIQEAIDFNNDSDLWISAPSDSSEGLYGGVLVTTTGTKALTYGISDPDTFTFTAIPYKKSIGTGDGSTTNFTDTLTSYVNKSLSQIIVGSTTIAVTVTDAEPEVISGTGISTGTITRATDAIDITFSSAPATGDKIYAIYNSDLSTSVYFALFSKSYNSLNDESVLVTYDTNLNYFKWNLYIDNYKGTARKITSYTGSIVNPTYNSSNENIYIDLYYDNNPYFIGKVNTSLSYSSFTDDTAAVSFACGARSSTFTSADYTEGWTYFKDVSTYPTKIFMDTTADSSIPSIFNVLRNSYQKFSRYLLPLPVANDADAAITTKSGYSIDNRGLYFFWNHGYRQENYTLTKFYSPLIGLAGVKYAEIMREAYGGLAPSWLNENGLGGKLSVTIEKMRHVATETDLENLDTAGINGINKYDAYGVIITSQKTGQDPNNLTDFSYAAHSGLADYHQETIINDVLVQQQTKLNDTYHRTKVKAAADAIIRVTQQVGNNTLLTSYINKCDEENNDSDVLNARQFVLTTGVQFTPTSEYIIYNYISAPQGVDVEEYISDY